MDPNKFDASVKKFDAGVKKFDKFVKHLHTKPSLLKRTLLIIRR